MRRNSAWVEGIVDVHCHVLPGLDDGSKSMEETLEMLRAAVRAGVTDIIATPHFKGGRHNASPATIRKSISKVREEADRQGIYVNLYPGNEIFLECVDILRSPAKKE